MLNALKLFIGRQYFFFGELFSSLGTVCMHTRVRSCVCTRTCVWSSEVNIWGPPHSLPTLFLDRFPHWAYSSLIELVWLDSESQHSFCLSLLGAGVTGVCHEPGLLFIFTFLMVKKLPGDVGWSCTPQIWTSIYLRGNCRTQMERGLGPAAPCQLSLPFLNLNLASMKIWTQGLVLAGQIFSDWATSQTPDLGALRHTFGPLACPPWVVSVTGICHRTRHLHWTMKVS